MPSVSAAKAPASFEIKSASLPLVGLLLKSANMDALSADLRRHYGATPDFFDRDPLLIDLSPLAASDAQAQLDFAALIELLRRYKLAPLAVCGGSAALTQAAQAAGLIHAPDAKVSSHAARLAGARAPAQAPTSAAAPPAVSAMLVEQPVRSGVQIYAKGRDLIINAVVNPGAEVIADGHIHVYAPLRGRAIAGAQGNAGARIFAMAMEPELIAIAGVYQTAEAGLPASVQGRPAQIRLDSSEAGKTLVAKALG